jgi:ubiquilin
MADPANAAQMSAMLPRVQAAMAAAGFGAGGGAGGLDAAALQEALAAMRDSGGGLGAGALDAAGLQQALAAMGGLGGVPTPPPPADPETAYAAQLAALHDMGFWDRQQNLRALLASGGDVNGAVERLLAS